MTSKNTSGAASTDNLEYTATTPFSTPKELCQQPLFPEPRKGTKRLTISPILLHYANPTKKSKAISDSSISSISDMSDRSGAMCEVTEEPMNEVNAEAINESPELVAVPMHPEDISRVAFELKPIMMPEMRSALKDEMINFQTMLAEAVRNINQTIKSEVAEIKAEVTLLRSENISLRKENGDLNLQVSDLNKRISKLEIEADAQEQYGRRNCLRISGVEEHRDENTDDIVLSIAQKLDLPITVTDIDRSHRVGKSVRGSRKIIVKFSTYRARQLMFAERKRLPGLPEGRNIFINEDLTTKRSKILFEARQIKRAKKITSAYSSSGKIVVLDNENKRHVIDSEDQLAAFRTAAPRD